VAAAAGAAALAVLLVRTGGGDRTPWLPGHSARASAAPRPTAVALRDIPPTYLRLYMRFGRRMDIDWRFLAAIGAQESNDGRDPRADRVNRAGCVGPMQLGIGGACGDFVRAWGIDGDGDGRVDPRDPADAIATAAHGLRAGKGAPPIGGAWRDYYRAACAYHGACSEPGIRYADEVMARAVRYGLRAH
jgi:hypothetical protein